MVVTEAIAAGLPVLTTTGGALAETLPPGAGIAVPPDDVDALAGALGALLGDRAHRPPCATAPATRARRCATGRRPARNSPLRSRGGPIVGRTGPDPGTRGAGPPPRGPSPPGPVFGPNLAAPIPETHNPRSRPEPQHPPRHRHRPHPPPLPPPPTKTRRMLRRETGSPCARRPTARRGHPELEAHAADWLRPAAAWDPHGPAAAPARPGQRQRRQPLPPRPSPARPPAVDADRSRCRPARARRRPLAPGCAMRAAVRWT